MGLRAELARVKVTTQKNIVEETHRQRKKLLARMRKIMMKMGLHMIRKESTRTRRVEELHVLTGDLVLRRVSRWGVWDSCVEPLSTAFSNLYKKTKSNYCHSVLCDFVWKRMPCVKSIYCVSWFIDLSYISWSIRSFMFVSNVSQTYIKSLEA